MLMSVGAVPVPQDPGPNVLENHLLSNNELLGIQPYDAAEIQDLVTTISYFDSDAAQEITDALSNGELQIGLNAQDVANAYATHDHDTIGVNVNGVGDSAAAVAVAHEWGHVKNAKAAGTAQDPTVTGSCGKILHATMTAQTATNLCTLIQDLTGPANEKDKKNACEVYSSLENKVKADLNLVGPCPQPTPAFGDLMSETGCPGC